MKTLQEITTEIIEATGWTQQELADRIGVSQPTIHRMLNGKCDDCMGETRLKIHEIYLNYGKCNTKSSVREVQGFAGRQKD